MPEWVLGAFQPAGWERPTPAGTELENTLAESHFPGERDFATLSRLPWQQVVLTRVPVSLREAICFPTATRRAAAVLRQEFLALPGPLVGEACAGDHAGLPALTLSGKAPQPRAQG